jgi:hypothetical protein
MQWPLSAALQEHFPALSLAIRISPKFPPVSNVNFVPIAIVERGRLVVAKVVVSPHRHTRTVVRALALKLTRAVGAYPRE